MFKEAKICKVFPNFIFHVVEKIKWLHFYSHFFQMDNREKRDETFECSIVIHDIVEEILRNV